MTAIICYKQVEHRVSSTWLITDSRISQKGQFSAYSPIGDYAIKLFPVEVNVYSNGAHRAGMFEHHENMFSFGLAYTGSSIVGLNFHATLSILLRDVISLNPKSILPFEAICLYATKLLGEFIKEFGVNMGHGCACSIVLCGYCMKNKRQEVYKIEPTDTPHNLTCEIYEFRSEDDVLILGDETEQIRDEINKTRATYPIGTIGWFRAPWKALSNICQNGSIATVGGYPQVGCLFGDQFKIFRTTHEATPNGNAELSFAGIHHRDEIYLHEKNTFLIKPPGLHGLEWSDRQSQI